MNSQDVIAYFKIGDNSQTNHSVRRMLEASFSSHCIQTVDVTRDLFRLPHVATAWHALVGFYHYRLARAGRHRCLGGLFYTPYYYDTIRRRVIRRFQSAPPRFSFQTQSLFDASIPGVPHFVYTDHTHLANLSYPGVAAGDLALPAWIERERTIYAHATHVFSMSQNIRRSLIEQYGCAPDKVSCVYGGCNSPPSVDATPHSTDKTILFIGVDWDRKGGPSLAEAFGAIQPRHPDARLVIVGCKPRLSLPHCRVIGPVSIREVDRYFAQAYLFCLPTWREPFGVVFIEAMMRRLPVIGTTIGAQPDFIIPDKTGFMVPPGDVNALATLLDRLLSNPDLCRTMGENGHRLASERYTWDNVGRLIKEQIERCMEPVPRPQ